MYTRKRGMEALSLSLHTPRPLKKLKPNNALGQETATVSQKSVEQEAWEHANVISSSACAEMPLKV